MAKNKGELEKENKELKKRLKNLQYEIEDLTLQQGEATEKGAEMLHEAFGIIKIGKEFKIAKLKFDVDSREATVISVEDVAKNPLEYANGHFRGAKELSEMMDRITK